MRPYNKQKSQLVCFSVERQNSSYTLRHGWSADSPVVTRVYGRAGHIWPQLPWWPRTTTRVVAAIRPCFRSMPARTSAANLPQYLGSTLPLRPTHQSTYPVNPTPYHSTPTAFTHQPPFPPASALPLHTNQPFPPAPGFTCAAIPNCSSRCSSRSGSNKRQWQLPAMAKSKFSLPYNAEVSYFFGC